MKAFNWHDIRDHRFARVALGVPRTHLGAPRKNLKEHMELIGQMHAEGAQFAGFPELSITGYSCGTMFKQEMLLAATLETLAELAEKTKDMPMLITVGAPLVFGYDLFNTAVSFYGGRPLAVFFKSFLPNYREFLESKFFIPGWQSKLREATLLGYTVPCGWDIILRHQHYPDFSLHHEVCEDLWLPVSPSSLAALWGSIVEMNLSASNVTILKEEYREDLVSITSGKNNGAYLYVSAGPGESNADHDWDGQMAIAERGIPIAQSGRFSLRSEHLTVDLDVGMLQQERIVQHSFGDNRAWVESLLKPGAVDFRHCEFGWLEKPAQYFRGLAFAERGTHSPHYVLRREISRTPFVPHDSALRARVCKTVHRMQTHALACRWRYLREKQNQPVKLVMNLSGGLDSTNVAGVAAHAADLLEYNRQDIVCLTIPGFGTTEDTKGFSRTIGEAFGFDFREISIVRSDNDPTISLRDRPLDKIGLAEMLLLLSGHDGLKENLAFENAQAWLRTVLALTIGAQENGMFVGSSTMTEAAVGWFTMHGDGASHFNVNASMPKSLERPVLLWMADEVFSDQTAVSDVLRKVAGLKPSPQLTRAKEGKCVQITDDIIGPEILREFFLYWGLRFGRRPRWIARTAWEVFSDGDPSFSLAEIVKWQKVFWRRFFDAQYKRNCVPEGVILGLLSLSPRGNFMWPSEGSDDEYQRELDALLVVEP